ncbi:MAG TPA: hypothetical protein PK847_08475 [Candidatus Sumerlaeota bacterium]|nr:hypothetical protein [Candidatus Sumerlaeota bacterium]
MGESTLGKAAAALLHVLTLVLLTATLPAAAPAEASNGDDHPNLWPRYRHDGQMSGRSPLRGGFDAAPGILWSADLGAATVADEAVRLDDVNGDGKTEIIRALSDRIICQSLDGDILWTADDLPGLQISQIRDWAGDGTRGILVTTSTGTRFHYVMVSGLTGKTTLLETWYNAFGGSLRMGKILADLPGEQFCHWWSGEGFGGVEATGEGSLWSFEKGVDHPTHVFHAQQKGTVYAPSHLFADMDLDGKLDMVMVSHEQLWIYDLGATEPKLYSAWGHPIRTYQTWTGAAPLAHGERPVLMMINRNLPGTRVVTQDGEQAEILWSDVAGGVEDQYQADITIDRGAPNPFIDLDGDGLVEILSIYNNEHGDGVSHLIVFRPTDGERLCEAPGVRVLTAEDLDSDGKPEIFLQENDTLRIAHWTGSGFQDLWQAQGVEPVFQPTPSAGVLWGNKCSNSVDANPLVWRETEGSENFLLRFPDGVWSCRLDAAAGDLARTSLITAHAALAPPEEPADARFNGLAVFARHDDTLTTVYEVPFRRQYLAQPPLVGQLDGETRVLARDHQDALVSLSVDGDDTRRLLKMPQLGFGYSIEHPMIADVDGDGTGEAVAIDGERGEPALAILNGDGAVQRRIISDSGAESLVLVAAGRLGPGQGMWIAVRCAKAFTQPYVEAYNGKTGELLWRRENYGVYLDKPSKFMIHVPTAVWDYDEDGVDDLLASSESYYGILDGATGEDLVPPDPPFVTAIPGHWGAYSNPIVADYLHRGRPQVFLSQAFGLAPLIDLDGKPIWHYGLSRDTTMRSHPGVADLDGDGKLEIVTTQADGLLRAFAADPLDEKCPTCPADVELTEANHSAAVRWEFSLTPPLSDVVSADLDGDGMDELLVGAGDGKLHALKDRNGQCDSLWAVELGRVVGSPVIADLTGTGKPVILVPESGGYLHALGGN